MNKIFLAVGGQIVSLLVQVYALRWLGIHLPSTAKAVLAMAGFAGWALLLLALASWTRRPLVIHRRLELAARLAVWGGLLVMAAVEAKLHSAMLGGGMTGAIVAAGVPALQGHVRDVLWAVPQVRPSRLTHPGRSRVA